MQDQPAPEVSDEIRATCESYVGRSRETRDTLAPEPAEKLAALLGARVEERLPPTWHWAYFNPGIPLTDQGHDLHERTGIFLPPAPFDRRMWAAGDVTVLEPLALGAPAVRRSTIADVAFKQGKSGAMCFVTVRHEIEQDGAARIREDQTIVYRDRGAPTPALRAPGDPVPEGYATYPEGKLFFYSAVTHNGHRIHWDRDFCRRVEGYPDLVVHGPLMATELCDALRGEDIRPLRFRYRAEAPVFLTTPVRIVTDAPGEPREGVIRRSDGVASMRGTLMQP
ncbi:acyl-CoA dehydrogenase [Roseovarius spongiae]|uniref:Acyl-CoA dehydrogenase n=1 Tax=Roseovarius spongiae TaxID=2320272 RepID=A0A3A8AYM3_9RHOB|nr:MaoC family dehydratase N-terminal domain-containing protein [Roseovarius spongiae]RKF17107.1 acyl-CoA dehydrogenase [Roseovarius spongiae]